MSKGGGKTVESSSDIPARYRDFADENLALAGTVANRPYIPYAGDRVAGFTPDQTGAFDFVRGLGGAYQAPLANAQSAYTAGLQSTLDPSTMMSKYQDPYTEQVIDATLNDVNESFDAAGEQSRMASPFGGSRLALREAQIEQDRAREVARIGSGLRSQGFNTAAQLGAAATDRIFGAGDRSLGLAGQTLGMGTGYADALAGVGAQQQGLNQANLDMRYGDFLDELNYPLQALSIRQSAIGQTPMGSVGRTPVQSSGSLGSMLGGIGGLLSGIAAF